MGRTTCTRRRALAGTAGLLATLAGCSGTSSGSDRSSAPSTADHVERDPAYYVLRNPEESLAAWIRPEDGTPTETEDRRRLRQRGLVASAATAERLAFADVDGVEEARSFVADTDFDRETLLLDPVPVDECFGAELCYIAWSATEYHTYYARYYRDVDVACRADARDQLLYLIRIPDTLDPEDVRGTGSGVTSGSCRGWERRLEARREERRTDAASGGGG